MGGGKTVTIRLNQEKKEVKKIEWEEWERQCKPIKKPVRGIYLTSKITGLYRICLILWTLFIPFPV